MSSNTQHRKNTNKIPAHQGTFTEAASCSTACTEDTVNRQQYTRVRLCVRQDVNYYSCTSYQGKNCYILYI